MTHKIPKILYLLTFLRSSPEGWCSSLLTLPPLHLALGQRDGVLINSLPLAELHRDPLYDLLTLIKGDLNTLLRRLQVRNPLFFIIALLKHLRSALELRNLLEYLETLYVRHNITDLIGDFSGCDDRYLVAFLGGIGLAALWSRQLMFCNHWLRMMRVRVRTNVRINMILRVRHVEIKVDWSYGAGVSDSGIDIAQLLILL